MTTVDIDKLAKLARLSIDADKREKLGAQLSDMIGFAASCKTSLEAAELESATESDTDTDKSAPLRPDVPSESLPREVLLANSPEKMTANARYFTTVRVIES